jgi:hypothetical protein
MRQEELLCDVRVLQDGLQDRVLLQELAAADLLALCAAADAGIGTEGLLAAGEAASLADTLANTLADALADLAAALGSAEQAANAAAAAASDAAAEAARRAAEAAAEGTLRLRLLLSVP